MVFPNVFRLILDDDAVSEGFPLLKDDVDVSITYAGLDGPVKCNHDTKLQRVRGIGLV